MSLHHIACIKLFHSRENATNKQNYDILEDSLITLHNFTKSGEF